MRAKTIALILPLLSACAAPSSIPVEAPPAIARAKANVGKIFWVSPGSPLGIQICNEPMGLLDTKCDYVKQGKFTIEAVENEKLRGGATTVQLPSLMYKLTFDSGRQGYISELDSAYATDKDPAIAAAECKRRGSPRIGMKHDQVIATCWGHQRMLTAHRLETMFWINTSIPMIDTSIWTTES